jgi:hypothetical protein
MNSTPFTLPAQTEKTDAPAGENPPRPPASVHPQRESFKVIAFDKVCVNSKLFQRVTLLISEDK